MVLGDLRRGLAAVRLRRSFGRVARPVQVKFGIAGAEVALTDVKAPGNPQLVPVSCTNPDGERTVSAYAGTAARTDKISYLWKTDPGSAGCRELTVKLVDGSYHRGLVPIPAMTCTPKSPKSGRARLAKGTTPGRNSTQSGRRNLRTRSPEIFWRGGYGADVPAILDEGARGVPEIDRFETLLRARVRKGNGAP